MYRLNNVLNNMLEKHEKGIVKVIYRYNWYNHCLKVYQSKKGLYTKVYRDNEIDRKLVNIFYHYFGI